MFDNPEKISICRESNNTSEVYSEIEINRKKILQQFPVAKIELKYHVDTPNAKRLKIGKSEDVAKVLRKLWNPDTLELQEQFCVLYLNNQNQIIGFYPHSSGAINGTIVDIRLVFATALTCGAVSLIASHNHPSGTIKPSQGDYILTKKLKSASEFLEIKLLDHIILTKESFYSFSDSGDL